MIYALAAAVKSLRTVTAKNNIKVETVKNIEGDARNFYVYRLFCNRNLPRIWLLS